MRSIVLTVSIPTKSHFSEVLPKFLDLVALWRDWALVGERKLWLSGLLTQCGLPLELVLAGLQSPVGKVPEAPSWGPGHTPPSSLALLLPCCSGGWVSEAAAVAHWNAWLPREPTQPFHLLLCHAGHREPQGPLQMLLRKRHKNPSAPGFPNDVETL